MAALPPDVHPCARWTNRSPALSWRTRACAELAQAERERGATLEGGLGAFYLFIYMITSRLFVIILRPPAPQQHGLGSTRTYGVRKESTGDSNSRVTRRLNKALITVTSSGTASSPEHG
eukprot:1192871-Prorocentrum_minimum.AAC.1